jgi:hypothetical protein
MNTMIGEQSFVEPAQQEIPRNRSQHVLWMAVLLALAGVTNACGNTNKNRPHTPSTSTSQINATFPITNYDGCTGSGRTNCAGAIQAAINAAQSHGGGTVLIPPGTFLFAAYKPAVIPPGPAITILGSGVSSTHLIKAANVGHPTLLRVEAPHSVVKDLTFDSQKVEGGGSVVLVTTSYVGVDSVSILGGPQTAWPLRFAGGRGVASPLNPSYAIGNQVNGVNLVDDPPPADDGLDFSFQKNASIANVTELGSRLGLYVDKNVTVSNYHFSPNPAVPPDAALGYFITAPSSGITITDFTTTGNGGKIGSIPIGSPRPPNSNIVIDEEHMLNPSYPLFLGDVRNMTIKDSQLGRVIVNPTYSTVGVIEDSSYHELRTPQAPQKSALQVIHCTVVQQQQ